MRGFLLKRESIMLFSALAFAALNFLCAPTFSLESRDVPFTNQDDKHVPQGITVLNHQELAERKSFLWIVADSSSQEVIHQKFIEKAEGWEVPNLENYFLNEKSSKWNNLDEDQNDSNETFIEYFIEKNRNSLIMRYSDRNGQVWGYSKLRWNGSRFIHEFTIVDDDRKPCGNEGCSNFEKKYPQDSVDIDLPDWAK